MKKLTKIIATISDRRCDPDFLHTLHESGVDIMRLNTAHQSPIETMMVINNIRKTSSRIAILLDTKGPELRTGSLTEPMIINTNDDIFINSKNHEKNIEINYSKLNKVLKIGSRLLIDDGELELEVIRKRIGMIHCKALNSGVLKSRKTVNIPGVELDLPSLSDKDIKYIKFAIENGIDFIAHSFVRGKRDITAIRKILEAKNSHIKVIAKIENQEGVDNFDEILSVSDGIMVARGDLAIEIPAEKVPIIQKKFIEKCRAAKKPIIIATQMLHSMIEHSRPTRAEVSDVANAILDGADAIMLSGETAFGSYPEESVHMMTKIAIEAEKNRSISSTKNNISDDQVAVTQLARSAFHIAHELQVREIIINSNNAYSAKIISSFRGQIPIFVKCQKAEKMRELSLYYGINAHIAPNGSEKKILADTLKRSISKNKLKPTDTIIYLYNNIDNKRSVNTIEVSRVEDYIK